MAATRCRLLRPLVPCLVLAFLFAGCLEAVPAHAEIDRSMEATTPSPSPQPEEDLTSASGSTDRKAAEPTPSQDASGSWIVPYGSPDGCYGEALVVPYLESGEGIWFAKFQVDPATAGQPFVIRFSRSPDQLMGGGITFLDAHGPMHDTGLLASNGLAVGTVPAGSVAAVLWSCEWGPMSATYHAGP